MFWLNCRWPTSWITLSDGSEKRFLAKSQKALSAALFCLNKHLLVDWFLTGGSVPKRRVNKFYEARVLTRPTTWKDWSLVGLPINTHCFYSLFTVRGPWSKGHLLKGGVVKQGKNRCSSKREVKNLLVRLKWVFIFHSEKWLLFCCASQDFSFFSLIFVIYCCHSMFR